MGLQALLLSFTLLFVSACSSPKTKLTKNDISSSTRVLYGKIKDLNPSSVPLELQFSYVLSEGPHKGPFSLDKYPNLEPSSDYFWITVPNDVTYFGVNSINFALRGVDGVATIRDNKHKNPLFGVNFPAGNEPIYIGEITIRSGTRKYSLGLDVEGFDLKEAFIRKDMAQAREFLEKNGIESKYMTDVPFKIKFQHTSSRPNKNSKL